MNIGIVGLGLIGGSLGLDFKAAHHHVLGLSRSSKTCDIAIQSAVADEASTNPSILQNAEVIFLCSPIGAIPSVFETIKQSLSKEAIITDVGSVKGAIVPHLDREWPRFIGGHPMAGTSESGITAAQSKLFRHRPYVLTPLKHTHPDAISAVKSLVSDLEARLLFASPKEHDQAVALISHLPIMISATLISTCNEDNNQSVINLAKALASSGFSDTSRVGGGNPELGRMVAQFNQLEVLKALDSFQEKLTEVRSIIAADDWDKLGSILESTHQIRSHFIDT